MIINFHFMQYAWLKHDDLISCKCFVTFYDDFERYEFQNCAGKIITSLP